MAPDGRDYRDQRTGQAASMALMLALARGRQQVVLPSDGYYNTRTLTFGEAAALPVTTIAAWETLFERFRLGPESSGTLLALAAAGGVGSMITQLARALPRGARLAFIPNGPGSRSAPLIGGYRLGTGGSDGSDRFSWHT